MTPAGGGDWSNDPAARAAFEDWVTAERRLAAMLPDRLPARMDGLDEQLEQAYHRSLQAWRVFEAQREAAIGPLAGRT
jgi:hypothetical protein